MTICIQWNVNGYYRRLPELHLSHHHSCLLALQETHLRSRNKVKLSNNNIYRHNHETIYHAKGGWAIFVSNAYNATLLPILSEIQNIEVSVSLLQISKINTTISSIYTPSNQNVSSRTYPNSTPSLNNMRRLQYAFIQTQSHSLIICSDFNTHSSTWGSKHLNTKGNIINHLLSNTPKLILLNN